MWRATPNPKCHVTFSKTKLNVNWHLHSIPKCHLNIWLTQYFRKLIFWMICNKKKLSIERKYPSVSHVSPNVEDGRPIHCIHFKPTKGNPHKSIKGLKVQPIAQLAFDCILICILQHSPIYVWNYPCSYICNCLKMPKKSQINEYSDLSIYKLATLKRKN
jgi:hypothetical protein